MIEDLSASIRALLEYELLTPGKTVIPNLSISFARPDNDFPPAGVTKPAVNLFLYDIREDLKLRHNEWFRHQEISVNRYRVKREPLFMECSYLVTAWSSSVTTAARDEHTVLSALLMALRRYNCLPDKLPNRTDANGPSIQILQGGLRGINPLPRAFAIQEGYLQNLGEFWRSMGHGPKPRFNYAVSIPVDAHAPIIYSPVRQVDTVLAQSGAPGS